MLVASEMFELARDDDFQPYDPARIVDCDWTGVDLRRESQGQARPPTQSSGMSSIRLLASTVPYDIVFDDDGSGEVADVVALRARPHPQNRSLPLQIRINWRGRRPR